jgi:hypothetical protein
MDPLNYPNIVFLKNFKKISKKKLERKADYYCFF